MLSLLLVVSQNISMTVWRSENWAIEANNFNLDEIMCHPARFEEQTGFFHPTSTRLRLLYMTRPSPAKDPFAT